MSSSIARRGSVEQTSIMRRRGSSEHSNSSEKGLGDHSRGLVKYASIGRKGSVDRTAEMRRGSTDFTPAISRTVHSGKLQFSSKKDAPVSLGNVKAKNKSDYISEDRVFAREEKVFSRQPAQKYKNKPIQRANTIASEQNQMILQKSNKLKVVPIEIEPATPDEYSPSSLPTTPTMRRAALPGDTPTITRYSPDSATPTSPLFSNNDSTPSNSPHSWLPPPPPSTSPHSWIPPDLSPDATPTIGAPPPLPPPGATPCTAWDAKTFVYVHQPSDPRRPSLDNSDPTSTPSSRFQDQFDQYLYQSKHIATPILPHPPAISVLEIASDGEPSRKGESGSGDRSPDGEGEMKGRKSAASKWISEKGTQDTDLQLSTMTLELPRISSRRSSHTGEIFPTSSLLAVSPSRSRASSMPDHMAHHDLYKLRNFAMVGNRVINRGDSIKSKSSVSIGSDYDDSPELVNSTFECSPSVSPRTESRSPSKSAEQVSAAGSRRGSFFSKRSSDKGKEEPYDRTHRVVMLGASGVGKSSLCTQFMSSEHLNTYESVEDLVEKEVCLTIDGHESRIIFVDHAHGDISVENAMTTYAPAAYLVVYAVDDQGSMDQAERMLAYLRMSGVMEDKSVILVANKTDLVRSRLVRTSGGKSLALKYKIKYIETSPCINHNVDELLVGVVAQINLRIREKKMNEEGLSSLKLMTFLGKVWNMQNDSWKSCSNLHIL